MLGIVLSACQTSHLPPAATDLEARLREPESLAVAHSVTGWSVLSESSLDSMARELSRTSTPCGSRGLRQILYSRLAASDSIHSPGEALRTGQGSCLALTSLVALLRERCRCDSTAIIILPGHVVPRWEGTNFETLRFGAARDAEFYRNFFRLSERPWYQGEQMRSSRALAGLLWYDLGIAFLERKQVRLATYCMNRTLKELPAYPPALLNLSQIVPSILQDRLAACALIGDPVLFASDLFVKQHYCPKRL